MVNIFNEPGQKPPLAGGMSLGNDYFHVILPGLKGGGRNLTGLREYIGSRGWVVASLSTRAGLKRSVFNLRAHYERLAQEIVAQAQGRIVRIYAHSLGGIEVLDLMKALARHQSLPAKNLEVIFISPPGVGQKGFSGLLEIGKRFTRVIKNLGLYDQNHLIPLRTGGAEPVQPQRGLFLEEWLPQMEIDCRKRKEFIAALENIDSKLLLLDKSIAGLAQEAFYLHQRHRLIKHLVERIICGKHISEERHQRYLQQHRELALDIAPGLTYLFISLIFAFKVLFNLYRGIDQRLLAAYEFCRRQEINTRWAIVVLGHDDLVLSEDYTNFSKLAASRQIPLLNFVFENEEHSSVAHKWELIDALENLQLSYKAT